ncbi:MAG: nitrogen regulation protein NR(II) [Burkholderiales bacterium]
MTVPTAALSGLDLLATAVVVIDFDRRIRYANPAAENLFAISNTAAVGQTLDQAFTDTELLSFAIGYAQANNCSYTEHEVALGGHGRARLLLSCTVTPIELESWITGWTGLLIEFRHIEQQIRIAREERMLDQNQANRELIRNLAHEIKNPLGGIRGAAQLLDRELDRPALHEYTQVIMKEADRLQQLMDRLLTPHRLPQPGMINIHEALERVRSLLLAEFPEGISVRRDYDTSLPLFKGDKEQIIQALLNVARNAAQAIFAQMGARRAAGAPPGEIRFRTRIARQVVLARKRYRHAIEVQIIDNGPGVAPEIKDRIFYPLVSGREGGSGLGLTIAQTFITQQHSGAITLESAPGHTCFNILLPLRETASGKS